MRLLSRACQAALAADDTIGDLLHTESICRARRLGTTGVEPLKLGEETLSESMLAHLSTMFSDVVDVVMFTRTVEARRTGADWIWCIDAPSGRYFMLVQAKRPDESMANGLAKWTITISTKPNKYTSKTQHQTLVDAASALGVTPFYCLFLPGVRTSDCDFSVISSRVTPWYHFPFAFVHLLPASAVTPPTLTIHSLRTHPCRTLVELVCCMFAGGQGAMAGDDYWRLVPQDSTFEEMVESIADNENLQSISGAIHIQVEKTNE